MDSTFIWAQTIGLFAMAINIGLWQIKKPTHIIAAYIPTNLLWTCQFLLLSGYTAAISSLLTVIKDSALLICPKQRFFMLIVFLALNTLIGSFFVKSWYDTLPILAVITANSGLFIPNNRKIYARGTLIAAAMWLTYNTLLGSWVGIACSSLLMCSITVGMARHENWEIGKCYKTFGASLIRSLFLTPRTYP